MLKYLTQKYRYMKRVVTLLYLMLTLRMRLHNRLSIK